MRESIHPSYPGYIITGNGEVYSLKRNIADGEYRRRLSSRLTSNGYVEYMMTDIEGRRRHAYAHRLVAECFIPNPDGLSDVNHRDLDKENNCIDNLEWLSHRDNLIHAVNHRGGHWAQKMTPEQKNDAVTRYLAGETQCALAEEYGVSQGIIHKAVRDAGQSRPRTTITDNQVETMRRYYREGRKISWIAQTMSVSYPTAAAICRGLRR